MQLLAAVGAVAGLVVSFILGFFALAIIAGVVLLGMLVIGIRVAWLRRRWRRHLPQQDTARHARAASESLAGEYEVISRHRED